MHDINIRQEIIDRVLTRRNRYHLFDALDPQATAFVIIDMQNTFCEPGAPAEVPVARDICSNINRLNEELRQLCTKVIWITSANTTDGERSDWDCFYNNFVAEEMRTRTKKSMTPGGHGQQIWHQLEVRPEDLSLVKNRYSALLPGTSSLERVLRGYGIQNVLIGGTKTNVCCESTGRDAMMLDFNVVMVSDCLAALSDDEHRASLETFIQQFGDVMTSREVLAVLRKKPN